MSFDVVAKKYAETVDTKSIHVYYERPNLLSLLPLKLAGLKILDIGCGSGWYADYLANKGAYVTAIDYSSTMVNLTKERLKGKGTVYCADLEEPLDMLPKNHFDIVIAPLVVHYIKEWGPLFQELSSTLKSNGLFIFSTHSPYIEFNLFNLENYFNKIQITDTWEGIGQVVFYHHTLQELCDALMGAGFTINKLLEPLPLPQMKTVDGELYEKLSSTPWFLFVRASKN